MLHRPRELAPRAGPACRRWGAPPSWLGARGVTMSPGLPSSPAVAAIRFIGFCHHCCPALPCHCHHCCIAVAMAWQRHRNDMAIVAMLLPCRSRVIAINVASPLPRCHDVVMPSPCHCHHCCVPTTTTSQRRGNGMAIITMSLTCH